MLSIDEKGIGAHLLKTTSKRRRTKAQFDQDNAVGANVSARESELT